MLVRACVSFVSKPKKNGYKNQENKRATIHRTTAHTRRNIRTPSLFPATGFITPDDDPIRLPIPPPTTIESRVAPPTAVAAEARGATMPLLPTRNVGGRRPDGRGAAPALAPPTTNEALLS